jgi:hypothetical protein
LATIQFKSNNNESLLVFFLWKFYKK